jgi:hypothetical protein
MERTEFRISRNTVRFLAIDDMRELISQERSNDGVNVL